MRCTDISVRRLTSAESDSGGPYRSDMRVTTAPRASAVEDVAFRVSPQHASQELTMRAPLRRYCQCLEGLNVALGQISKALGQT